MTMTELKELTKTTILEVPESWKPPKEIVDPIKKHSDEILNTIYNNQGDMKEDAPEKIIVLQRAATLPFEFTKEQLNKKNNNIEIIYTPVGKVIPLIYTTYLPEQEDYDKEVEFKLDEETLPPFIEWLKHTDSHGLKYIKEVIKNKLSNTSKILVIDDSESSGETVRYTLPAIFKASLDNPLDISVITYFDKNLQWEYSILDSLEMKISPLERSVLKTLLIGSVDLRYINEYIDSINISEELKTKINSEIDKGNLLLNMNNPEAFELAGYLAKMEVNSRPYLYKSNEEKQKDYSNNPGLRLLEDYEIKDLIDWRSTIINRIKRECEAKAD
jgi:hypothetical protein